MDNLFDILTDMFQKYTIADTANVFAIIEGLATVVAAFGAVFAVIISKKIAANQIELQREQNKISAMQVELTRCQNNIAIFSAREELYTQIERFFQDWSILGTTYLSTDDDAMQEFSCRSSVLLRFDPDMDSDSIIEASSETVMELKRKVYRSDLEIFIRLGRLFSLNEESRNYLVRIIESYSDLLDVITSILENEKPSLSLKEAAENFTCLLKSDFAENIISQLYKQIVISGF